MSQASDDYHTPVLSAEHNKKETFLVRIVSLDYYMCKPIPGLDVCFSQLEGTVIERVPVVQIYGSTPGGQKTCIHLHKVRQSTALMRRSAQEGSTPTCIPVMSLLSFCAGVSILLHPL